MAQMGIKFINPIIYKIKAEKKAMMQLESLTSTLSFSAVGTDRKINSSVGTEASSEDAFKKKISLCSCSSSISLQENLEHTKEKEVFARYLFGSNTSKAQKVVAEMNEIFSSFCLQNHDRKTYAIDLRQNETDISGEVISYFLDIWLRHMGYGTKKNRNLLLGRVKLFLGHSALRSFSRLYDNLDSIPLSKTQKRRLLVESCRNGWEYFIQELIKHRLVIVEAYLPK